ncbi:MAG: alpha/beta hydrolase [Culicoidibacterales bacterium]
MRENGFWFEASDGERIYIHEWVDVENPRGIIQLIHGMGEHGRRYADFAHFLNQQGYLVFADDHRGHGKTAGKIENIGKIKRTDFRRMKDDEIELSEMLKMKYSLPLYLIAHSFGSFIAQRYIINRSDIPEKVILIGTGSASRKQTIPGGMLAGLISCVKGDYHHSALMEKFVLGDFNDRIISSRTEYDWINSDEIEIDKYIADPYCGAEFTIGYYYSIAKGLRNMYTAKRLKKIKRDLPIYILTGEDDPVGEYGKTVNKLIKCYEKVGLCKVESKIFPNMRHEILNEKNKQIVYEDIKLYLEL